MNIALVAHDGRKKELLEWVEYNWKKLSEHRLYATGTTGKLISGITVKADGNEDGIEAECRPFRWNVNLLLSGPLGGDQQIGALIAEGVIDVLIFFCDNLAVQGHQNDVSALGRLASLYNIAYATNRTTADMILTSPLFGDGDYRRVIPKAIENYRNRKLD